MLLLVRLISIIGSPVSFKRKPVYRFVVDRSSAKCDYLHFKVLKPIFFDGFFFLTRRISLLKRDKPVISVEGTGD